MNKKPDWIGCPETNDLCVEGCNPIRCRKRIVEVPVEKPAPHRNGFIEEFRDLCAKHDLIAMVVMLEDDTEGGKRILTGGDLMLCKFVNDAFVRLAESQAAEAESRAPARIWSPLQ